jgi:transketolase
MPSADLDMRDAFFDRVYELAVHDPNIVFLTADHGAFSLEQFKKNLPRQYFNVGIAEQNMASVAAGLALSGKRVFIYSIINFVTLRCFEQINIDIGGMNLPITIVGVGAGFTYSTDGPTHHGIQDLAIMATISNLRIYNCSDPRNSNAFAKIAYESRAPTYVRIEKGVFPKLYDENENFSDGLAVLRRGRDAMLVSSGYLVHTAMDAATQLETAGVNAGVIDLYRIKPLNCRVLAEALREARAILVIEDNVADGGIGSMIATALLEMGMHPKMRRLTLGSASSNKYGSREWVYAANGLDVASIREAAMGLTAELGAVSDAITTQPSMRTP